MIFWHFFLFHYVETAANDMHNLSRYVCVGNSLPELALTSVQILYWVTQSHKAGRDVVTTIVGDKVRLFFILYGT